MKIEDYGFIGDMHTAALVGANGSIDWLCLPDFASGACFAALLGTEKNGRWQISPVGKTRSARQRYRSDTLILETEFETAEGLVRVTDCMPLGEPRPDLVRVVEGVRGRVRMKSDLVVRFDYGLTVPWVTREKGSIKMIAGPNALVLHSGVEMHGEDFATRGEFNLSEGERKSFVLTWYASHKCAPKPLDAWTAIEETERFWRSWAAKCTYTGRWRDAVVRSLITLKALTYRPTGGIVAAATTSLPESLGGVRNWDYRYCWLRDATFTLLAMMSAGYTDEASRWTDWLLRTIAGDPSQLQILYGVSGERTLPEIELSHLAGYENSKPVRVGNAAANQLQLDIYGEIMDVNHIKRELGLKTSGDSWRVERHLIEFVAENWRQPDEGIWEIRGPRRHFTHSKMMAWVALDRAVKAVKTAKLDGDVGRWRRVRDEIHQDVCAHGYNEHTGVFTQYYGSELLDASLLMMPLVGFLPPTDERVTRTIDAIAERLTEDGFVLRYHPEKSADVDGLPPGEGTFLPCSYWLVDCLFLLGRIQQAEALFEKLLSVRTPLGLLSEEYDTKNNRLVGNFPQAFSHVALVNSAHNLMQHQTPAEQRSGRKASKLAESNG